MFVLVTKDYQILAPIHQATCSPAPQPEGNHKNKTHVWPPQPPALNVQMCCPVKVLNILKCQMASRKLQAPTTSQHLQHMHIFSRQHRKSINTSSTTESRHSAGRNNNSLPKNRGVQTHQQVSAGTSLQFTAK